MRRSAIQVRVARLRARDLEPYSWDPPECFDCSELFDPWDGWVCSRCNSDLCDACADGHPKRCEEAGR